MVIDKSQIQSTSITILFTHSHLSCPSQQRRHIALTASIGHFDWKCFQCSESFWLLVGTIVLSTGDERESGGKSWTLGHLCHPSGSVLDYFQGQWTSKDHFVCPPVVKIDSLSHYISYLNLSNAIVVRHGFYILATCPKLINWSTTLFPGQKHQLLVWWWSQCHQHHWKHYSGKWEIIKKSGRKIEFK